MDGLNLIKEFSANGAVVVVRSGIDSNEDRALCVERGAIGCISKVLRGDHKPDVIDKAILKITEQPQVSSGASDYKVKV